MKYLDVKMMMERLDICRTTAYALVKRPDFPATRIGKKIVISEAALQAWLDNGGTEQRGA